MSRLLYIFTMKCNGSPSSLAAEPCSVQKLNALATRCHCTKPRDMCEFVSHSIIGSGMIILI